jgi:peroxiredoxin
MRQLVQLQENIAAFNAAGIAVVALTYDAPDLQQAFVSEQGISYPLLSDIDATSIKAMGILNTEYSPGDDHYGIPFPGIYVVNSDMEIVGKIFLDGYRTRVDARGVLQYALEALVESGP